MKRDTGITLIALVVTIVVLLILAAVSISMLTGENGIIIQAQNATIKNDNGTVSEALRLKLSEYMSNNEGKYVGDKIMLLKDDNIIDENKIINIVNLVGEQLKTGNGSDNKDVYKIEDNHLYYYDKNENKTDLGDLGDVGTLVIESDESLFEISDDGTISLKDYDDYYHHRISGTYPHVIEDLVIPRTVDGITVTKISNEFCTHYNHIKTLYIPDTVTIIGSDAFTHCENLKKVKMSNNTTIIGSNAFSYCHSLMNITIPDSVRNIEWDAFYASNKVKSIIIPNSVNSINNGAFGYWQSNQIIYIEFKENEIPNGWDDDWAIYSSAKIIYDYKNNDDYYYYTEYEKFAENYLANKTQQELEEFLLKGTGYTGTFDEFLAEKGTTREEIEEYASMENMTYTEFLKYLISDTNGWLFKIEYPIFVNYGTVNTLEELENIFLEENGKTFDAFLIENGTTREEFENSLNGLMSIEDALKYIIVSGEF